MSAPIGATAATAIATMRPRDRVWVMNTAASTMPNDNAPTGDDNPHSAPATTAITRCWR